MVELIIDHVRLASSQFKLKTKKNSHPFRYKNYLFAHNGSVPSKEIYDSELSENFKKLAKDSDTDSWVFFLFIIQSIESNNDEIQGISDAITHVKNKGKYTGLNFLLSDGRNLYGYRSAKVKKEYYSLFYLERTSKNQGDDELNLTHSYYLKLRDYPKRILVGDQDQLNGFPQWILKEI